MSVLPYRAKRFIRHNLTWHNIRFQWAVIAAIALILLWIASPGEEHFFGHPWYSYAVRVLLALVFLQFGYAAWKAPLPKDEPYLVKKYDSLKRWWSDAARPGYYAVPKSGGSMKIIRHIFCDFSEIYDLNGDLIGHEQDTWGDGHWTFRPVDIDSQMRMPIIAYLLTRRRKPAGIL